MMQYSGFFLFCCPDFNVEFIPLLWDQNREEGPISDGVTNYPEAEEGVLPDHGEMGRSSAFHFPVDHQQSFEVVEAAAATQCIECKRRLV